MSEQPGIALCCCRFCCKTIFAAGLTVLFVWLSLRASAPVCSIEQFEAFALNRTANSTQIKFSHNHTIHYDLKLKNENKEKRIYYDALNLTFYYKPNLTLFPIGNANFSAFRQGRQKSTHRIGSFDAASVVMWENATPPVVFRVELATAVRYRNIFWMSKRHRLLVGADLQVNDQGSLVRRKKGKGIKLRSGAAKMKSKRCFHLVGVLGIFLALILF